MVESQESIAYFLDIVKIFPFHYKMQKRNNPKNKYNCFHDQSIFTRKISFFLPLEYRCKMNEKALLLQVCVAILMKQALMVRWGSSVAAIADEKHAESIK